MRYVDEFRDPELITKASEEIRRLADPGRDDAGEAVHL